VRLIAIKIFNRFAGLVICVWNCSSLLSLWWIQLHHRQRWPSTSSRS